MARTDDGRGLSIQVIICDRIWTTLRMENQVLCMGGKLYHMEYYWFHNYIMKTWAWPSNALGAKFGH